MKVGFGKSDITPRVGVELYGFGPYLLRRSIGIRDRLWARAMAVEIGAEHAVIVSCDLLGTTLGLTWKVRGKVGAAYGVPPDAVMVCSTHTHSGPCTGPFTGWGEPDAPYIETLPTRIARACADAMDALEEAQFQHAEVPCQGVALNREYDRDAPPLGEVLAANWRPAKPELTDTTCHVLTAKAGDRLLGFVSYFGCHPVVCSQETRFIHGDYCGVATNQLEREMPGAIGLFLQGAEGDVNSCVVHKPEQQALLALDVIAGRYANAVRRGIQDAQDIAVDCLACVRNETSFTRKPCDMEALRALLAEKEKRVTAIATHDAYTGNGWDVRMETVYLCSLRSLIARREVGESLSPSTEIHGIRLGPLAILGSGFETMQAIKNEVCAKAKAEIPLVCSLVNDTVGYAPDRTCAKRGGYAADIVPVMNGQLPYANIHEELVAALLELDHDLERKILEE